MVLRTSIENQEQIEVWMLKDQQNHIFPFDDKGLIEFYDYLHTVNRKRRNYIYITKILVNPSSSEYYISVHLFI